MGRSILGTRESVLGFGAETVKNFFSRCYQPDRIVISATGNLSHDPFVEMAAKAFETIPPGNGLPRRVTPIGCTGVKIHPRQIEQVHICLMTKGLSITDPRRYTFSLMNTLLGGNMSSRLFQEIRERRGLAYAVYSFASPFVDTGMFGVYAGVAPENTRETIELILAELRKLRRTPVDAATLSEAKEYTKGSLLLSSESNENQMVRLAQNEIHFERYTTLSEILDRIDRVTPEDILDLAADLFKTDRLALTILGPVADPPALEDVLVA